jgi:glycosyltransferase involved in cell wall biosynthesis
MQQAPSPSMNESTTGTIATPPILIVGPDPQKGLLGGVARHMEVLISLPVLRGKVVLYDAGSMIDSRSPAVLSLARRSVGIGRVATQNRPSQIWINSSIYPTAFFKLLLLLFGLRQSEVDAVKVFFHGGRFSRIQFLDFSLLRTLAKAVLRRAQTFYFLSNEQLAEFRDIFPGSETALFANYLPYRSTISHNPESRPTLLFVGRLVRDKGVYEILAAYACLRETHKNLNIALWFAGDGPELESLKERCKAYPEGDVVFFGQVGTQELERMYSKAFALLLPSYHEAFPYAILEALRAGLPVVSTRTGAIPDIIEDGENGFLVPAGDAVALASAVGHLLETPQLENAIRENNYSKFCHDFSLDAAEKFYAGMLVEVTAGG